MKKISLPKYYQLNASIRTIREFCTKYYGDCSDCQFWRLMPIGSHDCMFNHTLPEDWKELSKEVLDRNET